MPIDFDVRTVFNEHNIRFRTKLRHLTYWLKWRVHSAIIGGFILPLPVIVNWMVRGECYWSGPSKNTLVRTRIGNSPTSTAKVSV